MHTDKTIIVVRVKLGRVRRIFPSLLQRPLPGIRIRVNQRTNQFLATNRGKFIHLEIRMLMPVIRRCRGYATQLRIVFDVIRFIGIARIAFLARLNAFHIIFIDPTVVLELLDTCPLGIAVNTVIFIIPARIRVIRIVNARINR